MDDQKKKSFAEILANTNAAKHNSDLQNLAHAKMASGAYSPRLIAFIDICNAVGLDVVLVPMEKTTIENKKPIAQPN